MEFSFFDVMGNYSFFVSADLSFRQAIQRAEEDMAKTPDFQEISFPTRRQMRYTTLRL